MINCAGIQKYKFKQFKDVNYEPLILLSWYQADVLAAAAAAVLRSVI